MNKEVNKKKALSSNSAASSAEESTEEINKRIEEIEQYVGEDSIKINNNELLLGTITKREEMKKQTNYKSLPPSDIALVDYGLNSPTNDGLVESRPALRKIDRIFRNPQDREECYWKTKEYQRKVSKFNEKIGYEVASVIIDKMIKHNSVFALSKPTPSKADVMADIFEVLFYSTGIYVCWGEKRLAIGDDENVIFKLDAKLVLLYDGAEYPVCAVEFAPYAGPTKIKTDRSKLLIEAKAIYDKVMGLNVNEKNSALLKVVNAQIMALFLCLEINTMSVNLVDNHLYAANSIKSYILPSTVPELKNRCKAIIGDIFDLKAK
ncbi:hypothetical protein G6F70_005461 [Rhizopus microsporus]|nr:hypothetical protein G6F71_005696 [Rhizopus microsporus]KAG1198844.1 hypothetical protein G6F70_005461 [Rhizopus microsporus]KAG1210260.1 hypothetical protein G6F69_005647 [Rhizopus microsporus]KAG1225973.1 hypothetical protein G6F67_009156 [Rhizopus microsporus]KAG1257356.1 hypothetical protein G6F68_009343 [Rhizopus microsporus]